MTRWIRGIMMLIVGISVVACAGDAEPAAEAEEPVAAEEPAASEPPVDDPAPAAPPAEAAEPNSEGTVNLLMNPTAPEMNEQAPATFRVLMETSKGEITMEFHRAWAPVGVDRVYNLVRAGFFDGVRFFRVLDGFMGQFGIHGDPAIQARWRGANIPDDPVVEGNTAGRVTFAKTNAPNTRSTQLFINFVDNSNLDAMGFSALGEVTEGMDVVLQLYSGYGESPPRGSGPEQGRIQMEGNEYLNSEFPELDYVIRAEIIPERQ